MLRETDTNPIYIMLVEDSPTDILFTQEAFEQARLLHQLHVVEDGVEALAFLRQQGPYSHVPQPDLILLDLNLPKKSGREVLAELNSPVEELRNGKFTLSQPAEACSHFYADDKDPQKAEELASAWANSFVEKAQAEIDSGGVNEFVKLEVTQSANLPKERSNPLSNYLLAGANGSLVLAVLVVLSLKPAVN